MGRAILIAVVLIAAALPASGQPAAPDIRVVGEHAPVRGDTPELARQLALVNGQTKTWQAAIAQLQTRPDIQALRLTNLQLAAFTAVIVEPEEMPRSAPPSKSGAPLQVPLRAPFNAGDAVRRMAGLKGDPDIAASIVSAWTEMQELYARLQAQTKERASATGAEATRAAQDQEQTLRTLTVTHLTARATASMARTEPATVGGRVASDASIELAGKFADQARTLSPDSTLVQSLTGDLLLALEQPEAAEEWYRKALAGRKSSTQHLKLAEVLRLQGKLDEAIVEVRAALRLDARSAPAHTDLGLILRQQGKVEESMAEYREAIRLDPDWSDAHNGLAVALAGAGQLEEAAAAFREIIRIDPDSTIGHYNLATALANLDRDVESAASLREVVRIYPNHYNAHFNLGELFRLEGKYDESAKQFREYVRLAPDTPQNQRNLKRARSYIQQFGDN